jgi:hypothetical protein
MVVLMVVLESKFKPFRSLLFNEHIGSNGNPKDKEVSKKEKIKSNNISSWPLFKMEAEVDIKAIKVRSIL